MFILQLFVGPSHLQTGLILAVLCLLKIKLQQICVGSFSLEIEDRDGPIKLIARNELGLNPVFDAWSTGGGIIDPTREQNFVISPLSTLVYLDDRFSYESVKEKLGVDSNFRVRFDDPYLSINNAASNKAALVNTQLLMMFEVLAWVQDYSGGAPAQRTC